MMAAMGKERRCVELRRRFAIRGVIFAAVLREYRPGALSWHVSRIDGGGAMCGSASSLGSARAECACAMRRLIGAAP